MKSNIIIHRTEKEYNKDPLDIKSQIELLKNRWLTFSNEEYAEEFLNRVSYYRLSAYMRFFLGDDRENFRDDVTFKDVTDLYNFDSDLKFLLLEALETIEIGFKTQITNIVSIKHGTGFWFMNKDNFISEKAYSTVMDVIKKDIDKNKWNSMPIKHYYNNYTSPEFPPCRMLMQIMSFWNVCTLYKALPKVDKSTIAKQFWLRLQQLESWTFCLSYLRNICAHSDWVWNRKMTKPMTTVWIEQYTSENDKLYCYLIVICYLFSKINKVNYDTWIKKLIRLINNSNTMHSKVKYMWFPENWKEVLSGEISIKNTKN